MNAEEFMIKQIGNITAKFPGTTLLYEFDKASHMHIIEVVSSDSYDSPEWQELEFEIHNQQVELFPGEGILFVHNDPYVQVEKPLYVAFAQDERTSVKLSYGDFHHLANSDSVRFSSGGVFSETMAKYISKIGQIVGVNIQTSLLNSSPLKNTAISSDNIILDKLRGDVEHIELVEENFALAA
jgi:hypothetical protein